jgi:hypothetical protein
MIEAVDGIRKTANSEDVAIPYAVFAVYPLPPVYPVPYPVYC